MALDVNSDNLSQQEILTEKSCQTEPVREFKTFDGVEIKRVYTPEDATGLTAPPLPGEFPFIRGLYGEGYRKKLWTIQMPCGRATSQQTNKCLRDLIRQGNKEFSLAFDLPTQVGLDCDDSQSRGKVGRSGVSISGIWDFERLFKDIDLENISVTMPVNVTAFIVYALYLALAKKRKADLGKLRGTLHNDILKEYTVGGAYIYPPEPSLRLATDLILYSLEHTPSIDPISISGYHMREAGSTAVDEIALTLANALVYCEAIRQRGRSLSEILSKLSFFFGVHNHFLEEVSKFRAARRVWAELLRERYAITSPKELHLRFHTQTCPSTLTREEPINNAVRVALEAMAAVLGGCQSLHTNSYDEAISISREDSQLLALRTQQILAMESGAADCADPLGGSWAVESLTGELAGKIRKRLAEIEDMGGMLSAIKQGYPSKVLMQSGCSYQQEIESGKVPIVGVNIFRGTKSVCALPPPAERAGAGRRKAALKVPPSVEKQCVRELERQRKKRDETKMRRDLQRLANAAKDERANIVGYTVEAVEAGATLGEIADCLRGVFGIHT